MVGNDGDRDLLLSSPVILYDYPKIAPESAGDLFDGTEIDEILTLRILALTDEEKSEMRQGDERARRMLERVEANPEHLANLHGAIRSIDKIEPRDPPQYSGIAERAQISERNDWDAAVQDWSPFEQEGEPGLESVNVRGVELRCGDRVRLCPNKKADIIDMALAGQTALIESIEQDYEQQVHLAVILEDYPDVILANYVSQAIDSSLRPMKSNQSTHRELNPIRSGGRRKRERANLSRGYRQYLSR